MAGKPRTAYCVECNRIVHIASKQDDTRWIYESHRGGPTGKCQMSGELVPPHYSGFEDVTPVDDCFPIPYD